MSYIIEQKVGKYTYMYECTAYRDPNGNPRNKREIIGKIDLKPGYLYTSPSILNVCAIGRRHLAGNPIHQKKYFTEGNPAVYRQRLRLVLSSPPPFRRDRIDGVARCFRTELLAGNLYAGMLPYLIR